MKSSTLAAKYRPKTFLDVVGQPDKQLLWYMIQQDADVPPVMLFCGPSGVGKTTAARIFATALNCDEPVEGSPCNECHNCLAASLGNHPNIIETDGSRYGSADSMRSLLNDALVSHGTGKTVFIIDEVQGLSAQAWNVMLKVFEEPPPGVLFILLTSDPMKIKPAIRNRAMRFDFGRVAPENILTRLQHVIAAENLTVSEDDLSLILDLCDGSVREAIMLLEQVSLSPDGGEALLSNRDVSFEVLHAAVRGDRVEGLRLLSEAYRKTGDAKAIVEQLGSAMEKILMAKYDIPIYLSPSKTRHLKELASALDDNRWAAAMEVLAEWALNTKSHSHLIFIFSSFLKALHGSAKLSVAEPKKAAQAPLVEAEAVNMLQGMTFD